MVEEMKQHAEESHIEENQREILLDWSHKQGRILTANGNSLKYYVNERGFPFSERELPHFHLLSGDTFNPFRSWAQQDFERRKKRDSYFNPIVGAWTRSLFVGGFEHSSNVDEITFNLQTHGLFIDIRIPRISKAVIDIQHNILPYQGKYFYSNGPSTHCIFPFLTHQQLKYYARRHAFAGYTIQQVDQQSHRMLCTRFHCIDWNFVGIPRPRPNKWFVEMHPDHNKIWKEWSFAKDEHGQHYYFEQWERLEGDGYGDGMVLSLRRAPVKDTDKTWNDGIIVVIGDHFSIIQGRRTLTNNQYYNYSMNNLVELVDAALDNGDRETAEYYLSIDAAHGRISNGWIVDCSIQYWKEGIRLFDPDQINVMGTSIDTCKVYIHDIEWQVYESSIRDTRALQSFFKSLPSLDMSCKPQSKL